MILLDCCLPVKLCISSSHLRLKSLEITNCTGMKQIEVSATSLTSFEHHGVTSFKHHSVRVKFPFSTPSLEKVSIGTLDRRGVRYIFSKLAKDLPRVKTLSFIPVKCIPKQIGWFFPFIKVEQLNFFALGNTNFDIRRIIAVLRACPRLQKIHLVTRNPVEHVQEGMPVPTKSVHKYLKEVEIGGFYGNTNRIEFALYFLKHARALERMVIDPSFDIYIGSCRMFRPKDLG